MARDNIFSVVKTKNSLAEQSRKKRDQKTKKELTAELSEIRQRLKKLEYLAGRYVDDIDSTNEDETRLRTIFESIQNGILLIDPERHTIVDVNTAAAKMIGRNQYMRYSPHMQESIKTVNSE